MRLLILCLICVVVFIGACTRSLSPEDLAKVQALRTELEATKKEVAAAEALNAQYSGGAIKVLIALRLEALKTNEALIQQRVHAIESGAKVTVQAAATKPDAERAKELEWSWRDRSLKYPKQKARRVPIRVLSALWL